ncbi:MAG: RAMP superfamily CRISPR-associated protein [Lachnospiraceae bacterium]|nr:RAMP superfamily CRISPR-associated protein [Lachnospiraceae bacterium]
MRSTLKMTLLSDTIFGNGVSIPGGEDVSVLCDKEGFPYYKGGTFKGIFREEMENFAAWVPEMNLNADEKLGSAGDDRDLPGKLRFYDFVIPQKVRTRVTESVQNSDDVLDAFTCLRTFTALDEEGAAQKNTLRSARCVKEGITLVGAVEHEESDAAWIEEVLGLIKYVGTMRNRGFGKVRIEIVGGMKG